MSHRGATGIGPLIRQGKADQEAIQSFDALTTSSEALLAHSCSNRLKFRWNYRQAPRPPRSLLQQPHEFRFRLRFRLRVGWGDECSQDTTHCSSSNGKLSRSVIFSVELAKVLPTRSRSRCAAAADDVDLCKPRSPIPYDNAGLGKINQAAIRAWLQPSSFFPQSS